MVSGNTNLILLYFFVSKNIYEGNVIKKNLPQSFVGIVIVFCIVGKYIKMCSKPEIQTEREIVFTIINP